MVDEGKNVVINPPPTPTLSITSATLLSNATSPVEKVQQAVDSLVNSVSPQNASFANAVGPLATIDNEVKSEAVNIVDKAYLRPFLNERLFALVDEVYDKIDEQGTTEEDRQLLGKLHRMFVDNGLRLSGPSRDRFIWISHRLIELRVTFMENLSTDLGSIWNGEHELEGLNTKTHIQLKKPDVSAVLSQCSVASTRREDFLRSLAVFPENIEIFHETVVLRDEAARLLGFSSFAAQKLRHQIVKSPGDIGKLLEKLSIGALQQLRGQGGESLSLWDFDYFHDRMLRERYHVDQDLIAEYFSVEVTIRRMLDVFGVLFGLSIAELVGRDRVWHPDAKVFSVWDTEESAFIGYLYIDIYPREGKFNHAANFNIYHGYLKDNGQRATVITALVCNASSPSKDRPALIQHRELITIFHELGHGMHDLLGKSMYAIFHGHRTVPDFVETPSQLLEYWCWVPECPQKLSCHYTHLSPDLIVLTLRQVAFSKVDMRIHNPDSQRAIRNTSIGEVYIPLLQDMTSLRGPEGGLDWGNGYVTTSHYMWGQEANYYSYLFTRILAAAIWFSSFRTNPTSQEAGLRYRRMVLENGGGRDEWEVLIGVLGREPRPRMYSRDLGQRCSTSRVPIKW
ncbi:hypothetical protein BDV23DRAFT_175547 [Aspergillus alliaceus]|uniref:Peptidase M3A/M3B catalytic domain-containing protein n=1 Tax=Petromyces alliaceus TaxID=209559 RepID=A0A5N7BXQ0_PETAA|nr:hypothetical protein BDV23DRAFT_175547 [Aspergillus alliaceus]